MSDEETQVRINTLPPAARRWLTRALPERYEIPATVGIQQEGAMDVRGRWTDFEATGVYSANPLHFDWKARLNRLPGVWINAEDGHKAGAGWGGARLWGLLSMGRRTDPEVLKAQVVRNLAELAWMPSLALTDADLTWSDADSDSFEVRYQAGEAEAMVRFTVDDQGDVIEAHSPARPYDVPGGYEEAPWTYDFGDWREFGGVRIPAEAVATFHKSTEPWQYMQVKIVSVSSDA